VTTTNTLTAALLTIIAADVVGQPAQITPVQLGLVGGYLLPCGRLDPREAIEARSHLRRLGGPRIAL